MTVVPRQIERVVYEEGYVYRCDGCYAEVPMATPYDDPPAGWLMLRRSEADPKVVGKTIHFCSAACAQAHAHVIEAQFRG